MSDWTKPLEDQRDILDNGDLPPKELPASLHHINGDQDAPLLKRLHTSMIEGDISIAASEMHLADHVNLYHLQVIRSLAHMRTDLLRLYKIIEEQNKILEAKK